MAPSKASRAGHEDLKTDGHPTKEKAPNGTSHSSHQANGKLRRVASSTGTNLRDVTNAASLPSPPLPPKIAHPVAPSLDWSTFDRVFLHKYRREHNLNTPTAYTSEYRSWVLSNPANIGINSPSMLRRQESRRQTKAMLTGAVRKHFNSQGIQENDAIVDFLHKVKVKDRSPGAKRKKVEYSATQRI